MALGQSRSSHSRTQAPQLGEHDVRVSVSHCGVCFTDIHAIDDYYGITTFPFVPGHEIVGHVEARGSEVAGLSGRGPRRHRVAGPVVRCGCEWCAQGEEQLCQEISGRWGRGNATAGSLPR